MKRFGDRLDEETRDWVDQGIITEEQREEILALHEDDGRSRAVRVILLLGAVMVGLGALLFVGANWSAIPVFGRTAILVGATTAAYYSGWRVKYEREGWDKVGDALLSLGALFVGATIFLTAQSFNVEANVHWLLLLWFVSVAPGSYAVESNPTLLLSVVLLAWWSASYVGGGAVLDAAEGVFTNVGAYAFYGVAVYGVGGLHEGSRFEGFAPTYKAFGPAVFFLSTYAVVVSELDAAWYSGGSTSTVLLSVTAVAAVVTTGANLYLDGTGGRAEAAWYAGAFALSAFTSVVPGFVGRTGEPALLGAVTVLYHSAFLALVVATVYMGYSKRVAAYVNVGLLFFVLYTGYLYAAKAAAYLGTSLAFVVGGVILLVGGFFLEKQRRRLVDGPEGEPW